jgi:hypothetical protein
MRKQFLSFKEFLNEALALVGPPGGPGMPQMGMPPGGAPPMPQGKGKKMPMQPQQDPLKPQNYQGFTNSPEEEAALRNLIVTQYDDPDTMEQEQPQDASWQTLNTAQQNASQRALEQLKAKQGMAPQR